MISEVLFLFTNSSVSLDIRSIPCFESTWKTSARVETRHGEGSFFSCRPQFMKDRTYVPVDTSLL